MSSNGNIRTLKGYTPEEAFQILATPLPPECYKPVPGGADLTDIDSVARDMVMNHVFGPCGVGWSYTYDQISVEPLTHKNGSSAFRAFIPKLELRVAWVVDGERTWSEPIPVAGSSVNSEAGYSAKGAATSAISGAASHLGFQQLVYQGKLTDRTAHAAYAKYGPHPFEDAIRSAMLVANGSALSTGGDGDRPGTERPTSATKMASDKQREYICTLLKDLGYEGGENEALVKNGLPRLQDMTGEQAGAAIARLKKVVDAMKGRAGAIEAEDLASEATPIAEQASEVQVNRVFALLAELGYTGENARKALTRRGYDPDKLTAQVAVALLSNLQRQVDARVATRQEAA